MVVVGGGPAGGAAAYWLAQAGCDVLVVEKGEYPRDKPCGDALTPRAALHLHDMGLAEAMEPFHRVGGIRLVGHGVSHEHDWAGHPEFPAFGYCVRRTDLDALVAFQAAKQGAVLWQGAEGVAAVEEPDGTTTVTVRRGGEEVAVGCRFVVVADGARSLVGASLGTTRNPKYPLAVVLRTYFPSPRHEDPFIEVDFDIRDRAGNFLPGYGWVFPLADGTVNVGVGLVSTAKTFKDVNTRVLLASFVEQAGRRWGFDPAERISDPIGWRLPMGSSITPHAGRSFVVAGDAGGLNNAFIGEGIGYAYETGRMAAEHVIAAAAGDEGALAAYPEAIDRRFGDHFKLGRLFTRAVGYPRAAKAVAAVGLRLPPLLNAVVPIMDNTVHPSRRRSAELLYRSLVLASRPLPL